ncbi:MAG TPA: hypothetical protein DCX07_03620, partial [Phycisphaerales bacterium]|nr:hypothetical protein [Phycisphaerales bacterium]
MKRSFGIISLLLAVGLFLATGSVSAQTVAEWQFDEKADAAAGAIVKLNVAADGASVESKLMSETVCKTGSTGIGNQWKAFLHSGYLDVGAGVGEASKDKFGLTTVKTGSEGNNAEYRKYLGFSGLGKKDKDQGGTVYLVVQPKNEWKGGSRRGLSGTGFGMGQPYSSGA